MSDDFTNELTINIRQPDSVNNDVERSRPLILLDNAPALKYRLQNIQQLQQFVQYPNSLLNACAEVLSLCVTVQRMSQPDDLYSFRQGLVDSITDLRQRIAELDYPASVSDKTCFLFCIVLDEFILNCDWNDECRWENRTLLSELFGMRNGGEQFYVVAEKALRQPNLLTDLLEVIYVLLKIGFKGQYRDGGQKSIDGIYYKIESVFSDTPPPNIQTLAKSKTIRGRKPGRQLPFLRLGSSVLLFLIAIWFGLYIWFDSTYSERSSNFTRLAQYTEELRKSNEDSVTVYVSTDEELKTPSFIEPSISLPSETQPRSSSSTAVAVRTPNVWVVQVGSFIREEDAQSRVAEYKFDTRGAVVQMWEGRYRILLPTASRASALDLAATVRDQGINDAFIFRSARLGDE